MSKPWLALLLMMLVALQAVTAAAAAHRLHSSDRHHELAGAQFENGGEAERAEAKAQPPADDCQHCCHCHGSFHGLIGAAALGIALPKPSPLPTHPTFSSSPQPAVLLRPPRA